LKIGKLPHELLLPVSFDAIAKLACPNRAEKRPRFGIRASVRDEIAKHEGLPLSVEGYIARAQWEGKESCNCKSDEPEMRDIHFWLTKEPTRDRSESIVVEVTPRQRAKHSAWTISRLKRIAERHERVRISGWLMFDGEHPDQVGKTRGTLWENHPVMEIEFPWSGLGGAGEVGCALWRLLVNPGKTSLVARITPPAGRRLPLG